MNDRSTFRAKPSVTTFIVNRIDANKKLQVFLAEKLKVSNRAAKTMLDSKKVWVNRHCVWMAGHILKCGDTVELQTSAVTLVKTKIELPDTPKLHVLFQDGDYLAVDKPSGMLATGGTVNVETVMRQQTGLPDLRVVHRLDKETTGCLLMATNTAAWEAAVAVFKTRHVTKLYRTIVWGRYERTSSTIQQDLDGEHAISHIRCEKVSKDASFLLVRIETGRTHQIRRHLASIRYPIIGDRQYGFKTVRDLRLQTVPRIMLHSCGLELPHPVNAKSMIKVHSPLPADFRRCLQLFGLGK
ncbi:MAG: RluA family pseudouridine synthase [Kiritimatiellae bacterium]|nr:RluA family pseudouridine synthase [Kiritimatiellia bacterium]